MMPSLHTIAQRRRGQGVTQQQLAAQSGISQSAITKIERGQMEPSYATACRLFEALDALSAPQRTCAQVMSPLLSVQESTPLTKVVAIIKKQGFSQIPVMSGQHCVGTVTETALLERIGKSGAGTAAQVMVGPLPSVPAHTPVKSIIGLLRESSVLVTNKKRCVGIVSKSDVL